MVFTIAMKLTAHGGSAKPAAESLPWLSIVEGGGHPRHGGAEVGPQLADRKLNVLHLECPEDPSMLSGNVSMSYHVLGLHHREQDF